VLFAAAERGQSRAVFAGAMAGFAVILAISALGAAGLSAIPVAWTVWLGIVPIAVGVANAIKWWPTRRDESREAGSVAATFPATVSLVLATGGDNVSAYVPLFYHLGGGEAIVIVAYAIAFAALALLAKLAFGNSSIHRALHRIASPLTSMVLIVVGAAMIAGRLHPA
jgi:cadmium resistance protein CadD (predicted permease)